MTPTYPEFDESINAKRVAAWRAWFDKYGHARCGVLFLTRDEAFGIIGQGALHNDVIAAHPYLKNNRKQTTMEFFWPPDEPSKVTIIQARVTHAPWFDLADATRRTREWLAAQPEYQAELAKWELQ